MSLQNPTVCDKQGSWKLFWRCRDGTCAPKMLQFVGDGALDVLHHVSNLCELLFDVFALVPYRVGADNLQDLTIRLRF